MLEMRQSQSLAVIIDTAPIIDPHIGNWKDQLALYKDPSDNHSCFEISYTVAIHICPRRDQHKCGLPHESITYIKDHTCLHRTIKESSC
jgi:hypothetical protein